MKRGIVLGVLLAAGGISLAAAGFQGREGRGRGPQGPNVAEIEKVNDRLYMITGGGGNTAAFITDGGVVLVDTKLANWGQAILDKVKSVTNKPITTIINTHTHGDHNGSNEFFGATVEFVSHENTKINMEKMDAFKGDKSVFIPKKTFKDKLSLGKGADEIDLYYFGRAHTGGDAYVVFPALRVMHVGDTMPNRDLPIMDENNGGTAVGFAKTLAGALTVKNVDTLINGHSPTTTTPADLKLYSEFITDFVAFVQDAKKTGKSVDDVVATWKTPAKYTGYAMPNPMRVKADAQVVWDETK